MNERKKWITYGRVVWEGSMFQQCINECNLAHDIHMLFVLDNL